jgi:hypothetical protein
MLRKMWVMDSFLRGANFFGLVCNELLLFEIPPTPLKKGANSLQSEEEVGKVGVKGDRLVLDKNINRHSSPLHGSTTE